MPIENPWLPVPDAAKMKGVRSKVIYYHLKRTQLGIAKQRLRYKIVGSMIYVSLMDVLALKIRKKAKHKEETSNVAGASGGNDPTGRTANEVLEHYTAEPMHERAEELRNSKAESGGGGNE